MRFLLLVSAAVAVPAIAAPGKHTHPATAAVRPAFTFLGHNPDVVEASPVDGGFDGEQHPCSQASDEVAGVLRCTDYTKVTVAGREIDFLIRKYNQGHLYYLFASAPQFAWGDLLSAFEAKYGKPIMSAEPWQNKAGATFQNTVAKWKFSNGVLELDRMGLETSKCSFEFKSDRYQPARPPAKVDF